MLKSIPEILKSFNGNYGQFGPNRVSISDILVNAPQRHGFSTARNRRYSRTSGTPFRPILHPPALLGREAHDGSQPLGQPPGR